MLTRRGICYDLPNSPYIASCGHSSELLQFHFSSRAHLNKFKTVLAGQYSGSAAGPVSDALRARWALNIHLQLLDLVVSYIKIESRGFYIKLNGVDAVCPEQLTFTDQLLIKR